MSNRPCSTGYSPAVPYVTSAVLLDGTRKSTVDFITQNGTITQAVFQDGTALPFQGGGGGISDVPDTPLDTAYLRKRGADGNAVWSEFSERQVNIQNDFIGYRFIGKTGIVRIGVKNNHLADIDCVILDENKAVLKIVAGTYFANTDADISRRNTTGFDVNINDLHDDGNEPYFIVKDTGTVGNIVDYNNVYMRVYVSRTTEEIFLTKDSWFNADSALIFFNVFYGYGERFLPLFANLSETGLGYDIYGSLFYMNHDVDPSIPEWLGAFAPTGGINSNATRIIFIDIPSGTIALSSIAGGTPAIGDYIADANNNTAIITAIEAPNVFVRYAQALSAPALTTSETLPQVPSYVALENKHFEPIIRTERNQNRTVVFNMPYSAMQKQYEYKGVYNTLGIPFRYLAFGKGDGSDEGNYSPAIAIFGDQLGLAESGIGYYMTSQTAQNFVNVDQYSVALYDNEVSINNLSNYYYPIVSDSTSNVYTIDVDLTGSVGVHNLYALNVDGSTAWTIPLTNSTQQIVLTDDQLNSLIPNYDPSSGMTNYASLYISADSTNTLTIVSLHIEQTGEYELAVFYPYFIISKRQYSIRLIENPYFTIDATNPYSASYSLHENDVFACKTTTQNGVEDYDFRNIRSGDFIWLYKYNIEGDGQKLIGQFVVVGDSTVSKDMRADLIMLDGGIEFATQGEVDAGTEAEKAVSPATLKNAEKWNTMVNRSIATTGTQVYARIDGVETAMSLADLKTALAALP